MDEAQRRREQFAAMVESWLPGVHAYFRKLGLGAATAEDLAQETFLAAWRKLPSLRDPDKMRSWLYGTAYHQYLGHRRRRAAPASLEAVGEAALEPEGDPGGDESLALRSIREAVIGLPDKYRQPLVLLYWDELSYEEAADVLSIPLGTLAWRVRKGLGLMREALAEEEATDEPQGERQGSGAGERGPVGEA